jgi:hypothetical protein
MEFLKHLLGYPVEITWAVLSIAFVLGAVAWSRTLKAEFKKGHIPSFFEILREIRRSNSRKSYLIAVWFLGGVAVLSVVSATLKLLGAVA